MQSRPVNFLRSLSKSWWTVTMRTTRDAMVDSWIMPLSSSLKMVVLIQMKIIRTQVLMAAVM